MTEGPGATFADAAEFERLRRDLVDAREEIVATNEVLTAMGRSASDFDLVLGSIVDSARRLCRADGVQLHLVDGAVYRLARSSGLSDDFVEHMIGSPDPPGLRLARRAGRLSAGARHRSPTCSPTPATAARTPNGLLAYRTIMGAPMLLDDDVVGVLSVWRTEVDPFDDRAITLLTAFAAAAAIAVRNLDLVRALEARSAELAHKVDQLEALGEVGEAVSSSLDLDMVLSTIVMHAVQLSDTDGGSLMEFDEADSASSCARPTARATKCWSSCGRPRSRCTTPSSAAPRWRGGRSQIADLSGLTWTSISSCCRRRLAVDGGRADAPRGPHRRCPRRAPAASRRLHRGDVRAAADFASQSALAILNARLFRELEDKTGELEVVSRHKSEFLASMSHELRTPLNAVIGFSEVLLDRMFGDINERQEEYLRDIWSSGKHLLELLNEILDLSKVEAGRMELESVTFSVVTRSSTGCR